MSYPVIDRDSQEWQDASRITNSIWQMAKDIDENLFMSGADMPRDPKQLKTEWDTCFEIARTAIQTQQIVAAIDRLRDSE